MIKIFRCTDTPISVLNAALTHGLAGISGGRISVRKLLSQVAALAESEGHEQIVALSTINHPYTELAYIYDESQIGNREARDQVVAAFDLTINQAD